MAKSKPTRIYKCPGCQREMKSSSGWTLHVKTCCPDLRYRRTRVKMEVTFDIPIALDDMNNHSHSPVSTPLEFFNAAFFPKEIRSGRYGGKKIGRCEVVAASLIEEPTIETRTPTAEEQWQLKRAEMAKDANSANRECRRVAKVLIGEPKDLAIRTERQYPQYVTFLYAPKNLDAWQHRNQTKMTLRFDLTKETIEVGVGQINAQTWPRKHPKVKTWRLANPKCVEEIQKFTGFKP